MGFNGKVAASGRGGGSYKKGVVCIYWLQGRCNRNPCRFVHGEVPSHDSTKYNHHPTWKRQSHGGKRISNESFILTSRSSSSGGGTTEPIHPQPDKSRVQKVGEETTLNHSHQDPKPVLKSEEGATLYHSHPDSNPQQLHESSSSTSGGDRVPQKVLKGESGEGSKDIKSQRYESSSLTSGGDGAAQSVSKIESGEGTIERSHPDSKPQPNESSSLTSGGDGVPQRSVQENGMLSTSSEGVLRVTLLQGHRKPVAGIALPACSDKLYTGSRDGAVRVWDCSTAECVKEVDLGCEIGCLTSHGPWIFVGLSNLVKVWNVQTEIEYNLDGPVGLVHALETTTKDMLFAGLEDGSILAWKYSSEANSFKLITTLKGHNGAVLSLKVGCRFLYSASTDNTIRRWDLDTLQCAQTLTGHTAPVMSLLCWDNYLLSCSLDQTIKVWSFVEDGRVDVMYTHNEEHAVLALFGMENADNKPILFASCSDGSAHLYELPWFTERGRIFAEERVRAMESGPGGLYFTGDESGVIVVWKLAETARTSC